MLNAHEAGTWFEVAGTVYWCWADANLADGTRVYQMANYDDTHGVKPSATTEHLPQDSYELQITDGYKDSDGAILRGCFQGAARSDAGGNDITWCAEDNGAHVFYTTKPTTFTGTLYGRCMA